MSIHLKFQERKFIWIKEGFKWVNMQTHHLRETTKMSSEKETGENSGRNIGAPELSGIPVTWHPVAHHRKYS